jgi:hypothetical protein
MHGIISQKNYHGDQANYTELCRVVVHYADGRTVTFVPEAGREGFSEDDVHQLVKVLAQASSAAEWAEARDIAGAGG